MEVTENVPGQAGSLDPGTWRCLVCSKPSTQIQVLPCQHKFCSHCLQLWAMIYVDMYNGTQEEFPCQVCWKRYAVPPQGLEAYEQDYQVKVLQETMKLMSMGHEGGPNPSNQTNPFGYTPTAFTQGGDSRVEESDYMQQPYDANTSSPAAADTAQTNMESTDTMAQASPCTSMVSYMVPQPLTGRLDETERSGGPGYCYRSHCHMYMHMV